MKTAIKEISIKPAVSVAAREDAVLRQEVYRYYGTFTRGWACRRWGEVKVWIGWVVAGWWLGWWLVVDWWLGNDRNIQQVVIQHKWNMQKHTETYAVGI